MSKLYIVNASFAWDWYGDHPASYSLGVEGKEDRPYHWPPASVEVKNECNYTYNVSYAFTASTKI